MLADGSLFRQEAGNKEVEALAGNVSSARWHVPPDGGQRVWSSRLRPRVLHFAPINERWPSIERENASLKGVLAKDYGRPALDKTRLGEFVDLVSTIGLLEQAEQLGDFLSTKPRRR